MESSHIIVLSCPVIDPACRVCGEVDAKIGWAYELCAHVCSECEEDSVACERCGYVRRIEDVEEFDYTGIFYCKEGDCLPCYRTLPDPPRPRR